MMPIDDCPRQFSLHSYGWNLHPGDVLLFCGTRPHSRIIEGWTGSPYSHVGVIEKIDTDDGPRLVVVESLEALGGGSVRMVPLDRYLEDCQRQGCRVDWYANDADPQQCKRIVAYMLRQWGHPYVRLRQMIWSFLRLNKVVRRWFGLPSNLDPERWFCSQLVAAAFISAGLLNPADHDPSETDPGMVASFPSLDLMGSLLP